MIIVGYQGIGKSTLAKNRLDIIDLESGWTKIDGRRDLNWEKAYVQIAEGLSRQGYVVFVSSHYCVQEALKKSKEPVVMIFPSLDLKNEWVLNLLNRWNYSKLEKDRIAYLDANLNYEAEIEQLKSNTWTKSIIIHSLEYDLEKIVEDIVSEIS